ncbi:MAG: hypothetical protein HY560_08595 [Gemmatimonadetes bacterium]|nr:hypothetical protein [Gemmatimonadota bacterium]
MSEFLPFDHQPDPVLGEALRELLTGPDDAAFARRVLAQMPTSLAAESWWDVLDQWARPGLAAAVLLLLATGIWLAGVRYQAEGPIALVEDVPTETWRAGALLASRTAPEFNVDLVLAGEPTPN